MRKFFYIGSVIFLLLLLIIPVVHAQGSDSPEIKTLEADQVIDGDYFIAGEQVEIYGTVNGDLYVAGGIVVVDGIVNGDVLVGGGDIKISGDVTQNVRAGGGQITVTGNIGRNITAVGGNIDFIDSATVGGNIVTAGGNTTIASPVGVDITTASGNLNLASEVGRNVVAVVGTLRLAPNAIVGGNLTYYSKENANIAAAATVQGEVTKKAVPPALASSNFEKKAQEAEAGAKLMSTLYGFLSSLLVGLILVKLYPRYLKVTSITMNKRPWAALGIGFLALIATPMAILFLLLTIIGIPIALITLAAYIIYIYLSKIFVSFWLGGLILGKTKNKVSTYWVFIAGLTMFTLLISLPIISGFVWLFTIIFGLGASILACKKVYELAREKELI